MSKYWKRTMLPDYSSLFKNWQTDISVAPHDGTFFMGRITGSNRSRAVRWTDGVWKDNQGCVLEICQWISFIDFADLRSCAWRKL